MKKIYQLAIAALAALTFTACTSQGGNGEASKSSAPADDANKSYSVKYSGNSNAGSNWESVGIVTKDITTPFEVEMNGDNVNITMPYSVIVHNKPLKSSLKGGKTTFVLENSSAKGKVEFRIADDKDYDEEFKKLGEGDTLVVTIKGETTKEMLDKINGNWGTFTQEF